MRTVAQVQDDITRKLHGTNLDRVSSIFDVMGEAAGNLVNRIDFLETIRETQITNGLYDDIYDYTAPSDLKGNKIIDIRKQVNRSKSDVYGQRLSVEFDSRKYDGTFAVKYVNGTKSIRISKDVSGTPITLHDMDSITANGTWAVGDDATNLTADTYNFIKGGASLNFDVDGNSTTGYIEISDMRVVDLTQHDEQSSIFVRVYIPDSSAVTNYILRWGNSSSAYWSRTVTTNAEGNAFEDGWNTLRFDWNGATETGTVDPATIDYLRLTVTYDGTADTDFRVDQIVSALGEITYLKYYSKYLFTNSSGTTKEVPTADTDLILLDADSYTIYLYELGEVLAQELQGEDSNFDLTYFVNKKNELIKQYESDNPSQVIKPQSFYYRL